MFGGSPLNRLSWLRPSHSFLNAIIASPATQWVLFKSGEPLVVKQPSDTAKQSLAYLTTEDVKPLLGPAPYFGQGKLPGELLTKEQENSHTEAARYGSPIVFLGLHELPVTSNALPSSDFADAEAAVANLEGTPYFAMDVADLDLSANELKEILAKTPAGQSGHILEWVEPRSLMTTLDRFTGGVFAQARSLVDWNQRNKVRFNLLNAVASDVVSFLPKVLSRLRLT